MILALESYAVVRFAKRNELQPPRVALPLGCIPQAWEGSSLEVDTRELTVSVLTSALNAASRTCCATIFGRTSGPGTIYQVSSADDSVCAAVMKGWAVSWSGGQWAVSFPVPIMSLYRISPPHLRCEPSATSFHRSL